MRSHSFSGPEPSVIVEAIKDCEIRDWEVLIIR